MSLNPRTTARVSTLAVLAVLSVVAAPAVASASEPIDAPTSTSPAPEPTSPAPAPEAAPAPAPAPAPEPAPEPVAAAAAKAPAAAPAPVAPAAAPDPADPCFPGACIDNGTVELGVNPDGTLLVQDRDRGQLIGLKDALTGHEALRAGTPYEGWGVADLASGIGAGRVSGGLGMFDPPSSPVTVESFDVTSTTATSVVSIGDPADPTFRVTHTFTPSVLDPNVYVVRVRIQNVSDGTLEEVRYRRVLDWDVEPTALSEIVSIVDGDLEVIDTRNDGFNPANPLLPSNRGESGEVDGSGPGDLGFTLDLDLGSLAAGEFIEFFLYIGVAPTEDEALESLDTVGATTWSTASPSGTADGSPGTFFLGYSSDPEVAPEPDPGPEPQPQPDAPAVDDGDEDVADEDVSPAAATTTAVPQSLSADVLPDTGTPVGPGLALLGATLVVAGGGVLLAGGRRRATS